MRGKKGSPMHEQPPKDTPVIELTALDQAGIILTGMILKSNTQSTN